MNEPDAQDDSSLELQATDTARLTLEQLGEILRLSSVGWTQRRIAEVIGCSQPAVCNALKRMTDGSAHLQSLLKARAGKALEAWDEATEVAAKRGDHRPAKELIETAYPDLRAQQGREMGNGITVIIGQPGQPVGLPIIDIRPTKSPDE